MNGIKKKKPWKRRLKKLIVLLVVLGLAVGAVRLFVWPSLQASATTTYGSYTATTGTISNAMSFSGNVNVQNSETFTASSAGTVREIYVSRNRRSRPATVSCASPADRRSRPASTAASTASPWRRATRWPPERR